MTRGLRIEHTLRSVHRMESFAWIEQIGHNANLSSRLGAELFEYNQQKNTL